MRKLVLMWTLLVTLIGTANVVSAQIVRQLSACAKGDVAATMRQTVILIDGTLMFDDAQPEGQLPFWRTQLARFVNAGSSEAAVIMVPNEYISIGTIKPDGTGVNVFFEGCTPLLALDTRAEREANESTLAWFLGNGSEQKYKEDIEQFYKSAASSAVLASRKLPAVESSDLGPFGDSLMMSSLRNFSGANKDFGIPRLVIVTDLSRYDIPQGEQIAMISAGHLDGADWGAQLGYSELHIISEGSPKGSNAFDYLSAFFLASQAKLETLATGGGALTNIAAPIAVRVFQGAIVMRKKPEITIPVKLRIAWDRNFTVVNSWIEETQGKTRFSPFSGSLSCDATDTCKYIGDGVFAQIWTSQPGGELECPSADDRLPFGGFRQLLMDMREGEIIGSVVDKTCFFAGMDDGLPFALQELENGRF